METEAFEIFAELSIAILGFTGIVAVLGNSPRNQAFIHARVRGLLLAASVAAIASVAPLTGLKLTHCSVLLLALLVGSQSFGFWIMRQQAAKPSWVVFYISQIGITVGEILLVRGLVFEPDTLFYAYMFSVCLMLLVAGLFFVRMVLSVTSEETDT